MTERRRKSQMKKTSLAQTVPLPLQLVVLFPSALLVLVVVERISSAAAGDLSVLFEQLLHSSSSPFSASRFIRTVSSFERIHRPTAKKKKPISGRERERREREITECRRAKKEGGRKSFLAIFSFHTSRRILKHCW